MGVYSHYQALPADGTLLRLLWSDADLYRVYCCLVGEPCGPFDLLHADEADRLHLRERLAEAGIEGDDAIRHAVAVFYRELDRTREEAPGVERRALLVKHGYYFDAIEGLGTPAHPRLGERLIFGGAGLHQDLVPELDGGLSVISAEEVRAGAAFLAILDERVVAENPEAHREWLALFRAAAERSEVVVVGAFP